MSNKKQNSGIQCGPQGMGTALPHIYCAALELTLKWLLPELKVLLQVCQTNPSTGHRHDYLDVYWLGPSAPQC